MRLDKIRALAPRQEGEPRTWADPALVAGQSMAERTVFVALIAAGAVTDMTAFKTTLDLFLRASSVVSWLLAAGFTCAALTLGWTIGRLLAGLRHGDRNTSRTSLVVCVGLWLFLGFGLCYVRWGSAATVNVASFGTSSASNASARHIAHGSALLFAALYLASGIVTAMEAARVTNPLHAAYRRTEKQLKRKRAEVAQWRARAERARLVKAHHAGEFDRDRERLQWAVLERQALGAEMANIFRLILAKLMKDPRKTDITLSGPVPAMPPEPPSDSDASDGNASGQTEGVA